MSNQYILTYNTAIGSVTQTVVCEKNELDAIYDAFLDKYRVLFNTNQPNLDPHALLDDRHPFFGWTHTETPTGYKLIGPNGTDAVVVNRAPLKQ